ncbi:MAG: PAS domain-containing protein, partial [Firmicutes bacterium]|nr:PAS domain-containing protein [Bacillota bacterium]
MSLRFKLRLGLLFLLLLSLLAIVTLAIRTSATPIFAVSIAVVLVAAYFATYYILEKTLITRWYDLKSSVSEIQRALLLNLDSTVDEHDDLLMMTASIEQIRVRVEEDQQQLLMMENLADLVSYLDPKGVLYYANHRHKTLLGYEPEALLTNDNPALFFHPDDIEIAFASLFNVVNTLQPERIEVRIRHIEGHYLWFESLYIPLFTTL